MPPARATVVGLGSALPPHNVGNAWFEASLDTSDAWIRQRTGIHQRRVLSDDPLALRALMVEAAQQAAEAAGLHARKQADLVVVASTGPEDLFGDAAAIVTALGPLVAPRAASFDIRAGCNGFLVAMLTAAKYLEVGAQHRALVIGGEGFSRWLDWADRSTCVLFGDGAGAAVMEIASSGVSGDGLGIIASRLCSAGSAALTLPLGVSASGPCPASTLSCHSKCETALSSPAAAYGALRMSGADVFAFAVTEVPRILRDVLEDAAWAMESVDWFVLHQANSRIVKEVADALGVDENRFISNIAEIGNIGAASLPVALEAAVSSGRLKSGDRVALAAFGAGFNWGAALLRWGSLGAQAQTAAVQPSCCSVVATPLIEAQIPAINSREGGILSGDASADLSPQEAVQIALHDVLPEALEPCTSGSPFSEADSLTSMAFVQRVREALGSRPVRLPPTVLLDNTSLDGLVAAVCAALHETPATKGSATMESCAAAVPSDSRGDAPLPLLPTRFESVFDSTPGVEAEFECTSLQRSMLLRHASDPQGEHFVETFTWDVAPGPSGIPLAPGRFRAAWMAVAGAHPALRSTFVDLHTTPRQRVWCPSTALRKLASPGVALGEAWFEAIEVSRAALDDAAARTAARQRRALAPDTPFPLFHVALLTAPPGASECEAPVSKCVLTVHHLLVDGWSMGVLLRDLGDAYASTSPLDFEECPSLAVRPSFEAYARYEATIAKGAVDASAAAHWRGTLERAPARVFIGTKTALLLDPAAPVVRRSLRTRPVVEALCSFARASHATMAAVAHAAWCLVLDQHLSGPSGTVWYGSTSACRSVPVPGIERVVGPVLNTVPVCTDVPQEATSRFSHLVAAASRSIADARVHDHVPLARAFALLDSSRPLEMLFDFQGDNRWTQVSLGGGSSGTAPALRDGRLVDRAGVALSVRAVRDGDALVLAATMETAQLKTSIVESMLHSLDAVLRMVASVNARDGAYNDLPLPALQAAVTAMIDSHEPRCIEPVLSSVPSAIARHRGASGEWRLVPSPSRGPAPAPSLAIAEGLPIHAVPADDHARVPAGASKPSLPSTSLERLLAEAVAGALSLPAEVLDRDGRLAALGLDSLRALKVLARARAAGIALSLRDVLRARTLRELASRVEAARSGPTVLGGACQQDSTPFVFEAAEESSEAACAAPYPLFGVGEAHFVGLHSSSFVAPASAVAGVAPQIYWEWVFGTADDSTECDAPRECRGQVDVRCLELALDILIARHPTLRAVVREDGTMFVLRDPGCFKVQQCSEWAGSSKEAEAACIASRAAMSGSGDAIGSPYVWPLFAFQVTHTGPAQSVVHVAMSLFLMDAMSDLVFRSELSSAYRALSAQAGNGVGTQEMCDSVAAILPRAPALTFADYSRSLVAGLPRSAAYSAALSFWETKIRRGLPLGPCLPRAPPAGPSCHEAGRAFSNASTWLTPAEWKLMNANCAAQGITLPTALLTAYCLALMRHQDVTSISEGEGVPCRFLVNVLLCLRFPVHPDLNRVIGNCSSTILVDVTIL